MITLKELLIKADSYKEKISASPPFDKAQQDAFDASVRIHYIYNSDALEGSFLSLSETKTLLEGGVPIDGQPLKESQEALGHAAAFDYMLKTAKEPAMDITEETIKTMHQLLLRESDPIKAGQYRTDGAPPSEAGYEASPPDEIPRFMSHLSDQIRSSKSALHPIELAAMLNKRLVDIRPFGHGNGIIARLLMNSVLVNSGYFVVTVHAKARETYLKSMLASRQQNDMEPFSMNIARHVINSGENYFHQFK